MNWQVDLLINELPCKDGFIGSVTLNRPAALNALSGTMISALHEQLLAWERDSECHAVLVQSSNPKAFCAGGDIRALHQHGPEAITHLRDYFRLEYTLNYQIATYPKPYIAIIDGIDMGGGVGISFHGRFPILTENARVAMPETTIGFFPDVGGSYYLARLPHQLGMYLALTGNTLGAQDCFYSGLAKFGIPQAKITEFVAALQDSDLRLDTDTIVREIIAQFAWAPTDKNSLSALEPLIERLFSADSVEQICDQLERENSSWSHDTLATLLQKSPTSLKVTFEQMRRVKSMSIRDTIIQDYRMNYRFLEGHDLYEGIRALLIDKDKQPRWAPTQLRDLSQETVLSYFEPLSQELELPLV